MVKQMSLLQELLRFIRFNLGRCENCGGVVYQPVTFSGYKKAICKSCGKRN